MWPGRFGGPGLPTLSHHRLPLLPSAPRPPALASVPHPFGAHTLDSRPCPHRAPLTSPLPSFLGREIHRSEALAARHTERPWRRDRLLLPAPPSLPALRMVATASRAGCGEGPCSAGPRAPLQRAEPSQEGPLRGQPATVSLCWLTLIPGRGLGNREREGLSQTVSAPYTCRGCAYLSPAGGRAGTLLVLSWFPAPKAASVLQSCGRSEDSPSPGPSHTGSGEHPSFVPSGGPACFRKPFCGPPFSGQKPGLVSFLERGVGGISLSLQGGSWAVFQLGY